MIIIILFNWALNNLARAAKRPGSDPARGARAGPCPAAPPPGLTRLYKIKPGYKNKTDARSATVQQGGFAALPDFSYFLSFLKTSLFNYFIMKEAGGGRAYARPPLARRGHVVAPPGLTQ